MFSQPQTQNLNYDRTNTEMPFFKHHCHLAFLSSENKIKIYRKTIQEISGYSQNFHLLFHVYKHLLLHQKATVDS